ncbi:hypothetical protein ASD64_12085 [Mesorhizobium sp. Root157]|uniref:hypothetical protein n=1 Tax=Mesorhizobium sp. Root157 TaxID=1736477 RepID=UPI0006F354F6|nr:hypothetical protein [Mesorhizobium sp. Root157]KQZ79095.1 hypothetical protein ASD64_12085 [Mesorhizobium sp. Root157]
MFSARWQIDAKFGHKQTVLELLHKWERDIGSQAGIEDLKFRIMTGSIGAREATIETHHEAESLARLEEFFARIAKIDAHAKWGKEMEPYVVSGTSLWNIFRIVE